MRRVSGFSLFVVLLAAMSAIAASSAHAQPYPVVYNLFVGVPAELTNPGGSLPGSNDWSCRPSSAHPNPVVLAHGTAANKQTNWGVYVPLLANEGYCVYAGTFGNYVGSPWPNSAMGGMLPIEQSAAQLGDFVDRVLAATGAARVDIVAHSQGNVYGNYFIKRLGGAAKVDKFVGLAPLWLGSNLLGLGELGVYSTQLGLKAAFDGLFGECQACPQVGQGSDFLRELNADGIYHPDVAYTNIATALDELVVPYTSGLVPGPGVTNIVVQDGCPTDYSEHAALGGSPRAAAYVLNALDPAHPRPVPCEFIPPFTG
ncbi:esterase/lipase family protein [Nocardia sp. 004]|uniref:esterase/lipase family protein n=1 Tax=Nocardia sp. 004 TaxID=3385978 RepID=UPI0039A1CEC5